MDIEETAFRLRSATVAQTAITTLYLIKGSSRAVFQTAAEPNASGSYGADDGNRTHLRSWEARNPNKIHRTRLRLLQASVLG